MTKMFQENVSSADTRLTRSWGAPTIWIVNRFRFRMRVHPTKKIQTEVWILTYLSY